MQIDVLIEEDVQGCPGAEWLERVASQVLNVQGVSADSELSLVIVRQERIRELNVKYLGRDRPTDVIAFSMLPEQQRKESPFVTPPEGPKQLGEVIISCPQAILQAQEQGHSVKREMAILVIHGILHILGYEDERPEVEPVMRAREQEVLKEIEAGLE